MIENKKLYKLKSALEIIKEELFNVSHSQDDILELSISISCENISLRDLSSFIAFIDGIYGRLYPNGIKSYALSQEEHLNITKIESGSWKILLETAVRMIRDVDVFIIIWLCLKYLPNSINMISSAYNNYEQGKLAREQRKQIKMKMDSDENLQKLEAKNKRDIAEVIYIIAFAERRRLHGVINIISKKLLNVTLRIKK